MLLKQVLLDISTQQDFLDEDGAIPVQNLVDLLPKLRRVVGWAYEHRLPVVSALDAHRPWEPLDGLPRHCVEGSWGQRKLPFTLLPERILIEADNSFAVPLNVLRHHRQVILRKRTVDFLANPKADRLLTELRVGEFIVCGVGVENGIKALVLGLMARQKRVAVVYDACGYWSRADAELSLRQLEAKGAALISADALLRSGAEADGGMRLLVPRLPKKRRRTARPRMGAPSRVQRR
jgi:nicotinamidase-related amidase